MPPATPSVLHEATIAGAHSGAQRAARPRRRGRRQPHRREDPRPARASPRRSSRIPRCSATTSAGSWCARPYESHPFPPGTPVFGMAAFPRSGGTYAEYAVVPSLSVARKPASLSHVEAAGVPLAALTAWGLVVETAHAHEGQRILIHAGSGGVGHFAVQFAAYFGAHVTATASGRNASWLRELGASVVIDHTTTRFEDVVADVDVVIDLVGNAARRHRRALAAACCAPAACTSSSRRDRGRAMPTRRRRPASRDTSYKVIPDGGALATIGRLLDSGAVQVYIDRVFDLRDAAARPRRAREGPHPRQDRPARQRRLTASATGDSTRRPSATISSATASSSVGAQVPLLPVQRHVDGRAAERDELAAPRAPPATGTPAAAPSRARAAPPSRSRSTRARSAAAARRIGTRRAQPARLQVVAAVEVDHGRVAQRTERRRPSANHRCDERRGRDRLVAHRPERADPAAGDRRRPRGHGAHDRARLEQSRR